MTPKIGKMYYLFSIPIGLLICFKGFALAFVIFMGFLGFLASEIVRSNERIDR